MRLSTLLNLGLIAAGAAAAAPVLERRRRWEAANSAASIVLDHADALAVSTRASLPLVEFLARAREHGATHVSLPELTLESLLKAGRLVPSLLLEPPAEAAPLGRWNCLAGAELPLLEHLAVELNARLPAARASVQADPHAPRLVFAGDLPTVAEMGLGFEAEAAAQIILAGLGVVPRPVSFSWPEDHLIERTLCQAAGLGARTVAFEGDIILGHEMHLDTTVHWLTELGLRFAFFCETRHQKGDWFIAKRLAPLGQVVLAHAFTPAALVPEDLHSAAHHWGMLARQRGIRLCCVNVFRRIHATEPLECLHYLEHLRGELAEAGLTFRAEQSGNVTFPAAALGEAGNFPEPRNAAALRVNSGAALFRAKSAKQGGGALAAPDRATQARVGLAAAGAAGLAARETLALREPAALMVTALAAAGAAALPFLDRPRGSLEERYPPSYAPKLLSLAAAASAPVAAAGQGLLGAAWVQAGAALSLAALTTGQDYQLRIEEYRSLNADLFLPLAAAVAIHHAQAWKHPEIGDVQLTKLPARPQFRLLLPLAGLALGWAAANRLWPDVLRALDRDLPAGHTHHLSAARRMAGDALLALGPRPGRKWAGLAFAGFAAARAPSVVEGARLSSLPAPASLAASLAGTLASALMLAAFRQAERPLRQTLPVVVRSWAWGLFGAALAGGLGGLQRQGSAQVPR